MNKNNLAKDAERHWKLQFSKFYCPLTQAYNQDYNNANWDFLIWLVYIQSELSKSA